MLLVMKILYYRLRPITIYEKGRHRKKNNAHMKACRLIFNILS